jgi:hypothetical protein
VTQPKTEKEMEAIRYLVDQRLKFCPPGGATTIASEGHLDEDAVSAFVEGRIEENESSSIVSHLVACGTCRDATARLIRLESLAMDDDEVIVPGHSPSRLRQWLEDLTAQVVPSTGEDAVFAYQNPDMDQNADDLTKRERKDSATEPEK